MKSDPLQCFEDSPQSVESYQAETDIKACPETVRNLLKKCKHLDLSERNVEIHEHVGHGGESDLFIGRLALGNGKKEKVAVKKLRTYALRQGYREKASHSMPSVPLSVQLTAFCVTRLLRKSFTFGQS